MKLATILARGGSRRVPGKNLRPLGGKPLIVRTIENALASGAFDTVAVSSDDSEILAAARAFDDVVLVKRPSDLASDESGKIPAIRHCAEAAETQTGSRFGHIVDLAVTSPFRSVEDVVGAVELAHGDTFDAVYSGTEAQHSPYFSMVEIAADRSIELCKRPENEILRHQDAPQCYELNGAVYVWTRAALFDTTRKLIGPRTGLYLMPAERSLDIDTELDFRIAEFMLSQSANPE